MSDRELESRLAVRAVTEAARLLATQDTAGATRTKESLRDIVTDADLLVQRHIVSVLAPSGHPVLSEEGGDHDPPGAVPTWIVDPIDGTANWVSGLPWYGISIGLRVGATYPVGAVMLPALNELFFSWRGTAYFNGRLIPAPPTAPLEASLIAAGFSGRATPAERTGDLSLFGDLNDASRGCLRLGSTAANLCAVLRGTLQVAYGRKAYLWDVAGALAVAEARGLFVRVRPRSALEVDYVVGVQPAAGEVADRLDALSQGGDHG